VEVEKRNTSLTSTHSVTSLSYHTCSYFLTFITIFYIIMEVVEVVEVVL
jgi:hypothetical protein